MLPCVPCVRVCDGWRARSACDSLPGHVPNGSDLHRARQPGDAQWLYQFHKVSPLRHHAEGRLTPAGLACVCGADLVSGALQEIKQYQQTRYNLTVDSGHLHWLLGAMERVGVCSVFLCQRPIEARAPRCVGLQGLTQRGSSLSAFAADGEAREERIATVWSK